jgi:hypothetical protein
MQLGGQAPTFLGQLKALSYVQTPAAYHAALMIGLPLGEEDR